MLLHGLLLEDANLPPEEGWLHIVGSEIGARGNGEPPEQGGVESDDFIGPKNGRLPIICPGFIDAHMHLPQIDAIGADGLELLEWLDEVIFPAEMKWKDETHAAEQIEAALHRMLRCGTLGFAGYLTSHAHGLALLAERINKIGMRGISGRVLMDRNAPSELCEQPAPSPSDLSKHNAKRLAPSINPRFAISCSDDLLAQAGAQRTNESYVQTHLAESIPECDAVRGLFPNDANYAAVYDRSDLLGPRTLLAHGVHLTDPEWELITERKSVVVHCPGANVFLQSGLFDLDAARKHDVRMALGSDVAAGPDLAMPRVARAMIETAKARKSTIAPSAHIPTPAAAWNQITRGNAEALGWPDAGRLDVDSAADLLVLRPPFEIDQHLIGRLLYTWKNSYIADRIVAGLKIT